MRFKNVLVTFASTLVLAACASTSDPNNMPLYGNYHDVDNQSLCLGMMAYASDFPQTVWPDRTKAFYIEQKEQFGIQSAALYKIVVKKYGKQDAAERGITGYSSAKSLAYVLGGKAVQEALNRCQPVAEQALAVDADYQNFLKHLGEAPEKPAVPEIASKPKVEAPKPVTVPVPEATLEKPIVSELAPNVIPEIKEEILAPITTIVPTL